MQYAILCYHDEKVTCAWSKEHEAAVMAKLGAVREKLERQGKLGPVARLLPTTALFSSAVPVARLFEANLGRLEPMNVII